MMEKVHVYMCLYIASIKSTVGNKTRLFLRLLRNDYVVVCSTARRSAEKKEMGGYVTVPFLSKLTQRKNTADWLRK